MASNKLINWTKPALANGKWPGVITTDHYSEIIQCGSSTASHFEKLGFGIAAENNCTTDNMFIRVMKLQPTVHRVVIQLHITTNFNQAGGGTGGRTFKLGVMGTIDDVSEDALWCKIPDKGIGAATHQHAVDAVSSPAQANANRVNITYNPFGVFSSRTNVAAIRGKYTHIGGPDDTDIETSDQDLFWFGSDDSTQTAVSTAGHYAQYVMDVDQLGYDYIAFRITSSSNTNWTAGQMKLLIRQFN